MRSGPTARSVARLRLDEHRQADIPGIAGAATHPASEAGLRMKRIIGHARIERQVVVLTTDGSRLVPPRLAIRVAPPRRAPCSCCCSSSSTLSLSHQMSGITNGFRQFTVGPASEAHAVAMAWTWPRGRRADPRRRSGRRRAYPRPHLLTVRDDVERDLNRSLVHIARWPPPPWLVSPKVSFRNVYRVRPDLVQPRDVERATPGAVRRLRVSPRKVPKRTRTGKGRSVGGALGLAPRGPERCEVDRQRRHPQHPEQHHRHDRYRAAPLAPRTTPQAAHTASCPASPRSNRCCSEAGCPEGSLYPSNVLPSPILGDGHRARLTGRDRRRAVAGHDQGRPHYDHELGPALA